MGNKIKTPFDILNHPAFDYVMHPGDRTIRYVFQDRTIRGTKKALEYALKSQTETFKVMRERLYTLECVPAHEIRGGDNLYFNISEQWIVVVTATEMRTGNGLFISIRDISGQEHIFRRHVGLWREKP